MYRVSIFAFNRWQDELWFDEYDHPQSELIKNLDRSSGVFIVGKKKEDAPQEPTITREQMQECLERVKPFIKKKDERAHGRWVSGMYPKRWYGKSSPPHLYCSVCKEFTKDAYSYCPHCGAVMDGDNDI